MAIMQVPEARNLQVKLTDYIITLLLAGAATKVSRKALSLFYKGKFLQAQRYLDKVIRGTLARILAKEKRPVLKVTADGQKQFIEDLANGKVTPQELYKTLVKDTYLKKFAKKWVEVERAKKKDEKLRALRQAVVALYELVKRQRFKTKLPKKWFELVKELGTWAASPKEYRALVSDRLVQRLSPYFPDIGPEKDVLATLEAYLRGIKLPRIKEDLAKAILEDGKHLVLRVTPDDIALDLKYLVLPSPAKLPKTFNRMPKKQLDAFLRSRIALIDEFTKQFIEDLRNYYRKVYGEELKVRWQLVKNTKGTSALFALSPKKAVDNILRYLVEAHGELARLESKFMPGDLVKVNGEMGRVKRLYPDGTLAVKLLEKDKTIEVSLLQDKVEKVEEEVNIGPKELKALKELGIKIEGRRVLWEAA